MTPPEDHNDYSVNLVADPKAMKLEIHNRRKTVKFTNNWRLNNIH